MLVARPSTRLVVTIVAAVTMALAGVGLTSVVAAADRLTRSGTMTLTAVADLDPAELGGLPAHDGRVLTAEDVARLQLLADNAAVVLQTGEDGSRRGALLWDQQVAIDVRAAAVDLEALDLRDAAEGQTLAQVDPFDLTAATRIDTGVLLQMAIALSPEESPIAPGDLLDLRTRAAQEIPDGLRPVLGELLAGRWVAVSGRIDPALVDVPIVDPAHRAMRDDVVTLVEELAVTTVGSDGDIETARIDLLELFVRFIARDDVPAGLGELGRNIGGWQGTSVEVRGVVTDRGQVQSVWDEVQPAATVGWDDLRVLHPRGD